MYVYTHTHIHITCTCLYTGLHLAQREAQAKGLLLPAGGAGVAGEGRLNELLILYG